MEYTRIYEVSTTADSEEEAIENFEGDGPECGPTCSEAVSYPAGSVVLTPEQVSLVIEALDRAAEDLAEQISFDGKHPSLSDGDEVNESREATVEAMSALEHDLRTAATVV